MITRLKLFIPVLLFIVMAGFLYFGLGNDPQKLPSVMVGRALPSFELPTLDSNGTETITEQDLIGEPFLMNIWATWCPSCLTEHPYLYELSQSGVKILGINYKDDSSKAVQWLDEYKNPYFLTVIDAKGRFGFDLGVTGAPETFVVNAEGNIIYRHVGVVNRSVWDEHFAANFPKVELAGQ